ncbi:MAG: nucleotidyl transferase AbiEii/AbiGii toxin family protein [Xanthobacteraceae bacterium]
MNSKATSLKSVVSDFMVRRGIPGEMEQNLVKEAIHLHLLSALSDAGILRHVVFQGGTSLRLCYGGERYSEDLDFVCGKSGSYLDKIEFDKLIRDALEATKYSLQRDFDIGSDQITHKQPAHPMAIKGAAVAVAAWQIVVPISETPRSSKSRIKIEFANVPSYDNAPRVARVTPGLVQIQDVILAVESTNEILADKAVALTAREALKYRDIWDAWYLTNRLNAQIDRDFIQRKFIDYGTTDVETKAKRRIEEIAMESTARSFLDEMKRFLPAKRVAEITDAGLHNAILAKSGELIGRGVLPASSHELR